MTAYFRPNPEESVEGKDFTDFINPDSLELVKSVKVEPSVEAFEPGQPFQLERVGYFASTRVPGTGFPNSQPKRRLTRQLG